MKKRPGLAFFKETCLKKSLIDFCRKLPRQSFLVGKYNCFIVPSSFYKILFLNSSPLNLTMNGYDSFTCLVLKVGQTGPPIFY